MKCENSSAGCSYSIHNVALGWAFNQSNMDKLEEITRLSYFLLELYQKKIIETNIRVIGFSEVKQNLIEMKKGHTKGKIVMKL